MGALAVVAMESRGHPEDTFRGWRFPNFPGLINKKSPNTGQFVVTCPGNLSQGARFQGYEAWDEKGLTVVFLQPRGIAYGRSES